MKVEFSREARFDLQAIARYIARDNAPAALRLTQGLRAACKSLSDFPDRHPLVTRRPRDNLRKLVQNNYLVFYKVLDDRVVIARILHGATDYETLLDGM